MRVLTGQRKIGNCIRVALGAAAILVFALFAQAEKLPLKQYSTSDGLAHDRVGRIVRDSRGFLWFCTSEGLSRFDGYQFKNYTRDHGLPYRIVHDLLETRDGQYWLATNVGPVLFNPKGVSRRWTGAETEEEARDESRMFRVFRAEDEQPGKWSLPVSRLIEDRTGRIWFAVYGGVYVLDRTQSDWKLKRIKQEPSLGKSGEFLALVEDNSGAIWVSSNDGIHRVLPDGNVQTILEGVGVVSLLKDRDGDIWAGSGGKVQTGLCQYRYNGLDPPKLVHIYTERDGLASRLWNYALLQSEDGTMWAGSVNGLSQSIGPRLGDVAGFHSVSKLVVTALAEDSGGNVWIGTESSGAFRLSRSGFKSFEESDGLKTLRGLSIANGVNGEVYFVRGDLDVIHRFDGDKFTTVAPLGMIKGSWGFNQIHFQDHTGEWWIAGDYGLGLQRYPRVNRLEELAHTKPKRVYTVKDGLPENMIFRLFEDSRGDIWIGTLEDTQHHLARWDRAADKFYTYNKNDGLSPGNGVSAFAEDSAGNIWIGFYFGGLARYRHGRFQEFTDKDGVPAEFVSDIHTDSAGRVWVATWSGGVARIDEPDAEQPRLAALSTADGLSSNEATCITEDKFGRIYIGTARGVNRLDTQSGRIKLFTSADGLAENLVNVCKRDKSGALWFGCYNGLSRFVPEPDKQSAPPPIFISDILVNGAALKTLSQFGETSVEKLVLASNERQVQINFFALGFSTGETLRYQYKLDSADWSELTSQLTVNLNLSPGSYRFLVRAVNAEGYASDPPATVAFSIAHPIWQRWWFVSAITLLAGLAGFAFYRYRVKRLIELERVRTRIATDLHDDIGSNLSLIAMVSEIAQQQINQDQSSVTDQLSLVARTSRQSVDAMSDIVWAVNPNRDHLHDLIERMRRFASDTFAARDIDFRFAAPASKSDLKLGADFRREVYMIFKESVNNMAKHSECTEAEIDLNVTGGHLTLRLNDNGRGFDAGNTSNGYGGNGLHSMRQRAAALTGTLDIESRPGKGTTITLKAPLTRRR